MDQQGICPPDAWGQLDPDSEYQEKGQVDTLEGGLQVSVDQFSPRIE